MKISAKLIYGFLIAMTLTALIGGDVIAEDHETVAGRAGHGPTPVSVPDGMMAILQPGGHGYVLVPGSPEDLVLAPNGWTVLRSRTPRGAQIIGTARNLSAVTEVGEPLPEVPDCTEEVMCGQLFATSINPDGSLHFSCLPDGCSNCNYLHLTCSS